MAQQALSPGRTIRGVDRDTLRSIQAPLKAQYRDDPGSAVVTLHAEGSLGDDVSCSVQTGRALVEAGLHKASGGDGTLACSGDMLLQALVACAGVTMRSVATALEIPVTGTVRAEGDLDFRGTLAVDREAFARAGYPTLPGGSYRSMWWVFHDPHGAFAARWCRRSSRLGR